MACYVCQRAIFGVTAERSSQLAMKRLREHNVHLALLFYALCQLEEIRQLESMGGSLVDVKTAIYVKESRAVLDARDDGEFRQRVKAMQLEEEKLRVVFEFLTRWVVVDPVAHRDILLMVSTDSNANQPRHNQPNHLEKLIRGLFRNPLYSSSSSSSSSSSATLVDSDEDQEEDEEDEEMGASTTFSSFSNAQRRGVNVMLKSLRAQLKPGDLLRDLKAALESSEAETKHSKRMKVIKPNPRHLSIGLQRSLVKAPSAYGSYQAMMPPHSSAHRLMTPSSFLHKEPAMKDTAYDELEQVTEATSNMSNSTSLSSCLESSPSVPAIAPPSRRSSTRRNSAIVTKKAPDSSIREEVVALEPFSPNAGAKFVSFSPTYMVSSKKSPIRKVPAPPGSPTAPLKPSLPRRPVSGSYQKSKARSISDTNRRASLSALDITNKEEEPISQMPRSGRSPSGPRRPARPLTASLPFEPTPPARRNRPNSLFQYPPGRISPYASCGVREIQADDGYSPGEGHSPKKSLRVKFDHEHRIVKGADCGEGTEARSLLRECVHIPPDRTVYSDIQAVLTALSDPEATIL